MAGEETRMQMIGKKTAERGPGAGRALRAALVVGCAIFVCACNTTDQQITAVPDVPTDYRLRHPITLTETEHTLDVFIGSNRGELNTMQRAEVLAYGQAWQRDATGGVLIELPVGTNNERAAAEAMRGIRSILAAGGVPPNGVAVRTYSPVARNVASIRMSYPRIGAQAGPCGLWPENIGPSFNSGYVENQPIWNAGCATQRNLAAMVDNPADLVQPRAEPPPYTPRRTVAVEHYRAGTNTSSQYQPNDNAKISDLGK
jgi:pilus assembly protein CpaD